LNCVQYLQIRYVSLDGPKYSPESQYRSTNNTGINRRGQISGMLLFRDFIDRFGQRQANGEIAFTPIISSLIVSLMSIGTLIGALSGAYTADWWGRRRSLSFGVCIFIIGNIIQITAMNSWVHMMVSLTNVYLLLEYVARTPLWPR